MNTEELLGLERCLQDSLHSQCSVFHVNAAQDTWPNGSEGRIYGIFFSDLRGKNDQEKVEYIRQNMIYGSSINRKNPEIYMLQLIPDPRYEDCILVKYVFKD